MPATKDGRCWACVQRRRWYSDSEVVAQPEQGGLRHLATVDGVLCKLPRRARHREPGVMAAYTRAYAERRRAANPEGYAWWRRHTKYDSQLRRAYGIRWADREAMYVAQGGRCASCWAGPAEHIDHDHATGRVRGLLCGPCNLLLGHAGDDPARLAAAIAYLRRQ